jgi:hypothetical protein
MRRECAIDERGGSGMVQLNYWKETWMLDERICPCDVHFNAWLKHERLRDRTIFHFGTGAHHVVGVKQATSGSNNKVLGVTASMGECDAYVRIVAENAAIAKRYVVYFGDIYLTSPELIPNVDVASLMHLCEFVRANTVSPEYGGYSDRGLLDLFTDKVRSGGYLVFYSGSISFPRAETVIAEWAAEAPVSSAGTFESLVLYRKK